MTSANKRVFVTGAGGFIGFHCAKALKARGSVCNDVRALRERCPARNEVLGYDNFNDYYDVRLKRARQAELEKIGVRIVEGDVAGVCLCCVCLSDRFCARSLIADVLR
jgi:UDP-glucuronate 4-epimerase